MLSLSLCDLCVRSGAARLTYKQAIDSHYGCRLLEHETDWLCLRHQITSILGPSYPMKDRLPTAKVLVSA